MKMSDLAEGGGGEAKAPCNNLHPILAKTLSMGGADDAFFKLGPMRPRANTDPNASKPRLRVRFDLPDIIVDDCSDDEVDSLCTPNRNEQADTEEGAFFVYTSPPRRRSNTLPSNMFRRKVLDRPPTPPPSDNVPKEVFHRPLSREMASFSPHKLTQVAEDVSEIIITKPQDRKSVPQKSTSSSRSWKPAHIPGTSTPDGRHSRNTVKSTRNNVDSPTSSPKRAGTKSVHSHRTTPNNIRDYIHSTA